MMDELIEGLAKEQWDRHEKIMGHPVLPWRKANESERQEYRDDVRFIIERIRAQPGWVIENITEPGGSKGWSD